MVRPATQNENTDQKRSLQPRRVLPFVDGVSAGLAIFVLSEIVQLQQAPVGQAGITMFVAILVVIGSLGLMVRGGQYTRQRHMSPLSDIGMLAKAMVVSAAGTTLLSFLTKGFFLGYTSPSRIAVGSFFLAFFLLSAASRLGLAAYQRRQFTRGRMLRRVLVMGAGQAAADVVQYLQRRPWLGMVCIGRVAYGNQPTTDGENFLAELPVIAILTDTFEDLRAFDQAFRSHGADEVVVALDPQDQSLLPHVTSILALVRVPFKVVPSLHEESFRATALLGHAELPVFEHAAEPLDRVARLFKRALDVVVATTLILFLAPLYVTIVIAILAESGFPVLYRQERIGKNGRRFRLYKFRTMVKDADHQLDNLRPLSEADAGGRIFKMRDDPRVTELGSILRKSSLDEFPQVVNVLKGEMSMVGPRPPLPHEVERYEPQHLYRLKSLPGITGLWQVSGRSDLGFEDMVKLDRFYIDNWSLRLDLTILVRTLLVVIARKGAY